MSALLLIVVVDPQFVRSVPILLVGGGPVSATIAVVKG